MGIMKKVLIYSCLAFVACACSKQAPVQEDGSVAFRFHHPSVSTKATDTGFENQDGIGVYMVYGDETLQLSGNLINNAHYTYNGSAWAADRTYYWPDNTSACDVVAYYPFMTLKSISSQPFAVAADQSAGCSSYDFMWAKTSGVRYTDGTVDLSFHHRLSKLRITVAAGGEYNGALPNDMTVKIMNTHLGGLLDLGTGTVERDADSPVQAITCHSLGSHVFEGIVIPQSVNRYKTQLFEVIAGDVSYLFSGTISYVEGYQTNVTLILQSNPGDVKQGIYIDGEYSNWD